MPKKLPTRKIEKDWDDPGVFGPWIATLDQQSLDEELWMQASCGDVAKAIMCIDAGANLRTKTGDSGTTPLMKACSEHQVGMVKLLIPISNLIDLNDVDDDGDTAAHRCAYSNSADCLLELVNAKVDLNKKKNRGDAAIFVALNRSASDWESLQTSKKTSEERHTSVNCLDILMQRSDLSTTNDLGLTPSQLTREKYPKLSNAMDAILAGRERDDIDESIMVADATPSSAETVGKAGRL